MNHPGNALQNHGESRPLAIPDRVADALGEALGRLRFGVVQLTVHEGRVVQLDVTERQRFS